MIVKKNMGIACLMTGAFLLSACNEKAENPIKTEPRKSTMVFLQKAAMFAEAKMNLPKESVGVYYKSCMIDVKKPINCELFFNEMLRYAKLDPVFKSLTKSELTDRKTYAVIEEDYRMRLFNTDITDLE